MDAPCAKPLTDDERRLLAWGLAEWGGPARATDELARIMGFASVDDLFESGSRLAHALLAGAQLAPADWRRALVATEIVWASDVYGSGVDSASTLEVPATQALALLRSIQRKLGGRVY